MELKNLEKPGKGDNEMIARHFSMENQSAEYAYDFGDDWEHRILLGALHDPDSAEDKELPGWIGVGFDPEYLDAKAIYFRKSAGDRFRHSFQASAIHKNPFSNGTAAI
ncbi:MAG: hypothetical protein U9N43_02090 [Euryarchaeota archaeon]|nr:hypothetical protein [Euryarchaeota archaeon]